MNTAMFVILVVIVATLISITFQFYMRDREISPRLKRGIWGMLIIGVIALLVVGLLRF